MGSHRDNFHGAHEGFYILNDNISMDMCQQGEQLEYADPPSEEVTELFLCPFNKTLYPTWEVMPLLD